MYPPEPGGPTNAWRCAGLGAVRAVDLAIDLLLDAYWWCRVRRLHSRQ